MGKTHRKMIYPEIVGPSYWDTQTTEIVVGDRENSKWNNEHRKTRKLKPYVKERKWFGKYKPELTPKGRNNNFAAKEEVRNANRSMKKGVRQGNKNEIKRILENL